MTSLVNFFGSLHLVFLHLPIGFLLLAGALACLSFFSKTKTHRLALDASVGLGAIAACFAATSGWVLAQSGNRDAELLDLHQWLGFTAAALACLTWWMRRSRWYLSWLAATIFIVVLAGHFGGSLTHGEGYLFENEELAAAMPTNFPPVKVEKAAASTLDLLRKNRIAVSTFAEDLPWLSVSVAGKKDLDVEKLALLKKVKDQIVHLDLSRSNADDAMLEVLRDLPHLTRLNLYGTNISAAGLQHIAGLQYLDYLNLTETKVGDDAVETLLQLPKLRSLFVWRSSLSPAALQRIQAQLPALQLQAGEPADTNAAPLQLRPPKILFARNIFDDTVQVALDFPFKTAGIFYTTNQASPTTQSQRYEGEALVFKESTTLRAISAKAGWENSPSVEAIFIKRKWKPLKITLLNPPSPKHPGDGPLSLGDGIIGDNHLDKNFVGYEGEHLNAVLDFGSAIEFQKISLHYVEAVGSWVFPPAGLQAWVSNDGQHWSSCLNKHYPAPTAMQDKKVVIVSEPLPKAAIARYLKIRVENLLKNPKWHPGAGKKCWVFVDEILVE